MIQANELRIGNWVEYDNRQVRLTADDICDASDGLKEFSPIPLTPEILLACGFVRASSVTHLIAFDMGIYRVYLNPATIHHNIGSEHYPRLAKLEYLHQLQNIVYALTGQELPYSPQPISK